MISKVSVMLAICNGKVLILRRGPTAPWKPGTWNLPGGCVDPGEDTLDAALREASEEAGIEWPCPSRNIIPLGVYPQDGFTLYAYAGEVEDETVLIRATDGIIEHDAWEWVDAETMNDYNYAVPVIAELIRRVVGVGMVA